MQTFEYADAWRMTHDAWRFTSSIDLEILIAIRLFTLFVVSISFVFNLRVYVYTYAGFIVDVYE